MWWPINKNSLFFMQKNKSPFLWTHIFHFQTHTHTHWILLHLNEYTGNENLWKIQTDWATILCATTLYMCCMNKTNTCIRVKIKFCVGDRSETDCCYLKKEIEKKSKLFLLLFFHSVPMFDDEFREKCLFTF